MDNANKRKFPRLSINVEVKYRILSTPSPIAPRTRTRNISEGGLCIMILEKVTIGTLLNLKIVLPDTDQPIIATGKVLWIDEFTIYSTEAYTFYECGVEYVNIVPQDQENICHYVMCNIKE
jgi:c-di-GMP-binding flagellar brake protein YcgR